ncbi:MAG: hypothetical protein WC728_12855 [Elusimicrobiota bacterium]
MRSFIPLVTALSLLSQIPASAAETPGEFRFSQAEVAAAKADPKAFTIDPQTIEFREIGPFRAQGGTPDVTIPKPPSGSPLPSPIPPIGPSTGQDPLVVIDRIINIWEKIWKIVEQNKPVVDIRTTYAGAVPDGITHWTQLAGWSAPVGTRYGFSAKNFYGVTVIDVTFVVFRQHSGNYKGKGKYLTGVTAEPTNVSVAWGYKLNINAEVPSVANVGTAEDPIASMMAKLNWKIATLVKEEQGTWIYYLRGDGQFREIASPFSTQMRANVKEAVEKVPTAPKLPGTGLKTESLKGLTNLGW